jgi:hypothetical protein
MMIKIIPALVCLLFLLACTTQASNAQASNAQAKNAPAKNMIPYPAGYDTGSAGASALMGMGDTADSPYFRHPDFYNLESGGGLTVIPQFETYQQTTDDHCGPASALMVLNHYGVTGTDELAIGEAISPFQKNPDGSPRTVTGNGTTILGMAGYFESIGWEVESSQTGGPVFGGEDFYVFQEWAVGHLEAGTPVLVEWCDWGGHWQVLIGYDTLGTEYPDDDVIILADPYDVSDHWQDGYYVYNADRFFSMWFDQRIQPEGQQLREWVIATPQR